MRTNSTLKQRAVEPEKSCKFYLPAELDRYIREASRKNFRTFTGQVEAMLQYARKAGI